MEKGVKNEPAATIDEYIAGFPKEVQKILQQVRATIKKAAPAATEKISYAIPTFFLNKNLVHFAAFKNHIGFYPTPTGSEAFKKELALYKSGKGSAQFPIDQPMPLDLIAKIVQYRIAEVEASIKPGKSNKIDADSGKAKKPSDEEQVAAYMADLDHPLKNEIEAVRKIIKNSDKKIGERIKWAAPSYYYKKDLVTFNLRATKHVHLVFHHAAITKISSPLLEGDYKDRRMTYLKNMTEVQSNKKELERIMSELVEFMDNE